MKVEIKVDPEILAQFCRKHHIRKLSLYGSVLTEDFRPDSDVDVLVEFEPDQTPGFVGLARMEMELSEIFKWSVDMRTPQDLSHLFRDEVLATAEVRYAA